MKLLEGDATRLKYENKFDAVLAVRILCLLPDDESVLTCLRQVHRSLKSGEILVCNIANPFYDGENWFLSNQSSEDITSTMYVPQKCGS